MKALKLKTLNRKTKILIAVIAAVLILIAAISAAVLIWGTASVYFYTPDSVNSVKVLKGSEVSLDPPALVEGYTFVGWEDEWGNMESRDSITLYEDTYYSAVYSVALNCEEHVPYMFPDKYGFFRPNAPMVRSDVAQMLYSLLSVEVTGSENFIDVTTDAPYYKATAALKELHVVEGSRFHPDEPVTRRELLKMLSAFFPSLPEKFEFSDMDKSDPDYGVFCTAAAYGWIESGSDVKAEPDETLTRLDTAIMMNRILGRIADSSGREEIFGFVLDVPSYNRYYYEIAEAVVDHSYSQGSGTEIWLTNAPIEKYDSGFFLAGTELYYISEKGYVVRRTSVGGFSFDENGRYTCGMPELDELVQGVLSEIIDDSMEPLEMLEAAYDYTVESFTYLKRNYYTFRDTSWANEEAYTMLTTGYGNCYCYAATFYQLARALGFDATIYSGYIGIEQSRHGWVEIDIDGEPYIFDTEIEMAYKEKGQIIDMFMLSYQDGKKWCYIR